MTKTNVTVRSNATMQREGFYLLVACAGEGVLDRMWWVSALLAAEAPLAGGVARATGHPGSVLAGCCCFTDQRFYLNHVRRHKPPAPRQNIKVTF